MTVRSHFRYEIEERFRPLNHTHSRCFAEFVVFECRSKQLSLRLSRIHSVYNFFNTACSWTAISMLVRRFTCATWCRCGAAVDSFSPPALVDHAALQKIIVSGLEKGENRVGFVAGDGVNKRREDHCDGLRHLTRVWLFILNTTTCIWPQFHI